MRVGDQPAVVLVGQLFAPKRGQPQVRDGGGAAILVEVGEVPRRHGASRSVENQGQGRGHDVLSVSHPGMAEIDWRRQALLATMGTMALPPMPLRTASQSDVLLCARVSHWRACCFSDVADGGTGVPVRAGRCDPVRLGIDRPCDLAHWPHAGPRPGQRVAHPGRCSSSACIWRCCTARPPCWVR